MRDAFLTPFLQIAGDVFIPSHGQPRIVIYRRRTEQELRIDGPREGQEWWTNPWTGDPRGALTFADDAGVAAALDVLPSPEAP